MKALTSDKENNKLLLYFFLMRNRLKQGKQNYLFHIDLSDPYALLHSRIIINNYTLSEYDLLCINASLDI